MRQRSVSPSRKVPEQRDVLVLAAEDIQVQWEVGMTAEEAVAFYAESLPEEGWTISSRRERGDSTRFAINGHGWDGAVTILGGDPVKVLVQLGLAEGTSVLSRKSCTEYELTTQGTNPPKQV